MPSVYEINPLLLNATTLELVQIFNNLQEQRVGTYVRFDSVFKSFLENQDMQEFERQCTSITKSFAITSSEIRDLEIIFRQQNKEILADIIKDIQVAEKDKLLQTSKLQVLLTDQKASDDSRNADEIKATKAAINQLIESINQKLEELHFETEGAE